MRVLHALDPRIPLEPGRVDDGVKDLLLEDRLAPRHPRLLLLAVAQAAGNRAVFHSKEHVFKWVSLGIKWKGEGEKEGKREGRQGEGQNVLGLKRHPPTLHDRVVKRLRFVGFVEQQDGKRVRVRGRSVERCLSKETRWREASSASDNRDERGQGKAEKRKRR